MKKFVSISIALLAVVTLVVSASAQGVTYDNPWFTSWQVVNLGDQATNIVVTYYDVDGNSAGTNTFPNVPANGSVAVLQATEITPTLASGEYSAVFMAEQPIAAIGNQQTGVAGSGGTLPPFSSYGAASSGSKKIILPVVMYNWFGYYTEVFIQNVGTADAANIDIAYYPTKIGTCVVGAAGQTDNDLTAPQYATEKVSHLSATKLGAPAATGCEAFEGRFMGAAIITSDQDIAVVVNQHVQGKLFTYNGFNETEAATSVLLPAYMRNFYGYYASLTIANPDLANSVNVTITYNSDADFSAPASTEVVATAVILPGESINRYEGFSGTADQTDIEAEFPIDDNHRFFGSVLVESSGPVVAFVNQETDDTGKGGAYNGMGATQGSTKISVPLIQSDFYNFYTSLTIMTVDGGEASLRITYTSDNIYSSVKNHSESYTHSTVGGFLNRYEGASATAAQSDILDDAAWESGGARYFIGSAVIEVLSGSNIVAFVNPEADYGEVADLLYSYNAFNQ